MSGGALDYLPYRVKSDIFGYSCETSHQARQLDPLKNPEISELVFDVCELLHEAEWYLSGDTSIADYDEAIDSFKTKWLSSSGEERAEHIVEEEINIMKKRILEQLRTG